MVLLPLLIVPVVAGLVTAGLVLHWPSADPASPRVAQHAARKVEHSLQNEKGLRHFLARRANPGVATGLLLTIALGIILLGGFALGVLAVFVRSDSAIVTVDRDIAQWAAHHTTTVITDAMNVLTQLGGTELVLVAALVVLVVEYIRRPSAWIAPFLAIVLIGQSVATNGIKELLDRVRPDLNPAAHLLGPSFPSGHSATAAAFWAATALLIGRGRGIRAHGVLVGAAVAIAVTVACTRVLLGVHWFSDVIAGLALGWAWFALCSIAFGGRLLRFGAPVEIAERALALPPDPSTRVRSEASVPPGPAQAAGTAVGIEHPRVDEVKERSRPA